MNPNMANREVMNLYLLDYKTKVPYMKIDFANVSTTNFTANRVYAKGGLALTASVPAPCRSTPRSCLPSCLLCFPARTSPRPPRS